MRIIWNKYPPGPLFVLFGPGTEKGQEEIRNWPTHYKRSKCVAVKVIHM